MHLFFLRKQKSLVDMALVEQAARRNHPPVRPACITKRGGWTWRNKRGAWTGAGLTLIAVETNPTTVAIQNYLDDLAGVRGDSPAEPIVRALLSSAVNRLHVLCVTLLVRSYPRLTRPPLNLQSEEMLSAVV